MKICRGEVASIERSNDVVTTGDGSVRGRHVSLIQVDGARVIFKSREMAPISVGDYVSFVGEPQAGQFLAHACRNDSTGWSSKRQGAGCLLTIMVLQVIIAVPVLLVIAVILLSLFTPETGYGFAMLLAFPFGFGCILLYIMVRVATGMKLDKKAHQILADLS